MKRIKSYSKNMTCACI